MSTRYRTSPHSRSVIVPLAPAETEWQGLLQQLVALPAGGEMIVVRADDESWPAPPCHCALHWRRASYLATLPMLTDATDAADLPALIQALAAITRLTASAVHCCTTAGCNHPGSQLLTRTYA